MSSMGLGPIAAKVVEPGQGEYQMLWPTRCERDMLGTSRGSLCESKNGVACCHGWKVHGCGRCFPPRPGDSSKMGSVNPQLLACSVVRYTDATWASTMSVGKYARAGNTRRGRIRSWKRVIRSEIVSGSVRINPAPLAARAMTGAYASPGDMRPR